jgi:hypothetical protein
VTPENRETRLYYTVLLYEAWTVLVLARIHNDYFCTYHCYNSEYFSVGVLLFVSQRVLLNSAVDSTYANSETRLRFTVLFFLAAQISK